MAKKPKTKVDLSAIKEKLKAVRGKLKEEKIGQEVINDLVTGIRENSINWKTGKKFQDLSDVTPRGRRYLAKYNKTHKDYSEDKPNLTITGKFLDSIKAKIAVFKSAITWSIDVSGTHPGYKTGGKRTGRIKNKELRNHLASIDRDPLGLSKKVRKAIGKLVEAQVKAALRKV